MGIQISVIVPTYNRVGSLLELLQTLFAQTLPAEQYEVIVVNDGSPDDTANQVARLQAMHPQLRLLTQANSGPAAARNRGAKAAQADLLAFTDDDCLASSDWLKNIVQIFESKPHVVGIQGRTSTNRALKTPLTHQIDNEHGHPALPTCNAAFRKSAFSQINGFDESFPYAHNEDADLAWRIRELGEVMFAHEVHIIHPPRTEKFAKLAKRMKILESEFLLYYKDPEKYRRYRQPSPWRTIYGEVFFTNLFGHLRSALGYAFRPKWMLAGIALNVAWWISLIRLYPTFRRADQKYKAHFGR